MRLTNRQLVLSQYPDAHIAHYKWNGKMYKVVDCPHYGNFYTNSWRHYVSEKAAWDDAAKEIKLQMVRLLSE